MLVYIVWIGVMVCVGIMLIVFLVCVSVVFILSIVCIVVVLDYIVNMVGVENVWLSNLLVMVVLNLNVFDY